MLALAAVVHRILQQDRTRNALRLLLFIFVTAPAWGALGLDVVTSADRSASGTSITSPAFSTRSGNELLLAFVSTDARSAGVAVTGVTGGNLTWVLVRRTNTQLGTAEIWRAFAPSLLSNATVRATLSQSVAASITVVSFTGADTAGANDAGAIGATAGASAPSGAPSASLVTTRDGSWVFGVGTDYDRAIARTLGTGQTMVHQYLASVGDTYWVQRQTSPTAASGTPVTINDIAPTTDRYNLSIIEVLPLPTGGTPTFNLSGSITPAASGAGAAVTLQGGTATTIVNADANGSYVFPGLANGTYTVTPSRSGFSFSPVSQTVTINGSNMTMPAFTAAATTVNRSISGTITPSAAGAGTLLALSGAASASTTANSSGNYSFTGLADGSYTITPSKSGTTFTPASRAVIVNGSNVTGVNFTAQATPQLNRPDLSVIVPPAQISVVGTGANKVFQYTHDTFNGGSGPLVIQPAYNPAAGTYQGTQYVYSLNNGQWTIVNRIPVAGAFVFHAEHGHFHYPFASFGIYRANSDGSIGDMVAQAPKVGFCIADSFIYDQTLPNAGALGNLGPCSDPTSLRGLDIGAVDEYDRSDDGQSIPIPNLPDGTYWLRAIVDPFNYLEESTKGNNETDVQFTLVGNAVTVLRTVVPVLSPPTVTLSAPLDGATLTGSQNLAADASAPGATVQFLVDGVALGTPVSPPYAMAWDTSTVPDGSHWLAAQSTDASGRIGTSAVARVTTSNGTSTKPPVVQVTDPHDGATVSTTIALGATVASANTITRLQFFVDGAAVGAPLTAPPFIAYWNSQTVPDGPHTVTASATDSNDLTGTSTPVNITVDNSHPALLIGKDAAASIDGSGLMQTPLFSTQNAGDFLVAFVAYDGPAGAPQTATVSGAGLTWTLLKRSNMQSGTAEIWGAQASGVLSNVRVTSQPGTGSYHGSMTVIAFNNASGPGVVGQASAPTGAPDIFLPGVTAGNWVFAVGNDWDRAISRTPVAGQEIVHQYVDTEVGDTFWVQSTTAPSTANALVTIHDNAPTTDQWNYVAVEIVAKRQ